MASTHTRPARSRWLALAVLCGSMLMIILDGTIVSVALPAIQTDLGFSATGLAWTVNAYLVPLGGLLLLAGRLGDLRGRRRMLVGGLVLFVVASLLCGTATGAAMLVAARFLQGVAAAMASAVVLGMVVGLFPEPAERGRAMGVYAFVGAAGASLGLLLGGVLTETVGWRWIFFVNVPIGVVAVVLALATVAPDPAPDRSARADVLGGALVTAGLMLAVLTIVGAVGTGIRLGLGLLSLALLGAFVARQRRAPAPLVRLAIFRSRAVTGGNLAQLLMVFGMLGFQFVAALYLQRGLGYEPAATGFAMVPVAAVIAVVSLAFAGRLLARFGPRPMLLAGEALLVVGLLWLTRTPTGGYASDILPALLVLGVGAGLSLPAVTTITMSDATPADAGLVSGLANTSQQVGGALGIAVLAAFAAARTASLSAAGTPAQDALIGGYHVAFGVAAAAVAASALVTLTVVRPRAGTVAR
jgi:EmrB/QacA subfamily drug resistance transporter